MPSDLSRLQSPAAVQAALDEFGKLGRTAFLQRYGFGKSKDFLVKNPASGQLCDSKAVAGAAFGYQFPEEGPLKAGDFSGGEATVVPKLRGLGFEVVRIGEDWSSAEVQAAVAAYFEMLRLEANQQRYNKTEFNAGLRKKQLQSRSKASVELKHQNISAVLHGVGLPFVPGYKPRGNAQLLLRQEVQKFILANTDLIKQVVDALEEVKSPHQQSFKAVLVEPPQVETVMKVESTPRVRLPRKVDYASRDESNRELGRAGEQWAIQFEQHRLIEAGQAELFAKLEWVSDKLGDGSGFDILSYDAPSQPRYIEVKTTNGSHASAFIISRNEVDFSKEAGDAFFLYRLFRFRDSPALYMLRGDVSSHLYLEPVDYRASFRRMTS
ncbi:DUF3883 domain-containing protein [Caldimonas tepidiphila]|uniref:DUF3883 domain-containing protein n=1 Tax=Caldimonas tepidiphila TaxID=2315841 RepID=UPI000E5A891B|nr:DUF3883 domain-containing protein [Caldimonas tepidiphila]